MKEIRERWTKWIDRVELHARDLCLFHHIYKQIIEVRENNPFLQKGSWLLDFIFQSYASWACMCVRRLIKSHRGSISFRDLLEDIKLYPHVLSKEYFKSLYQSELDFAEEDFYRYVAKGKDHIDPTDVYNDIVALEKATELVEGYADKIVAHIDKQPLKNVVSWEDIDRCVEIIEKLVLKYRYLIKATGGECLVLREFADISPILKESWIPSKT